jgi:Subtilase family
MAERPLLALPQPDRRAPPAGRPPIENIQSVAPARQSVRLGPKFERLERALPTPAALAELREDPTAIVPERALVFEVASSVVDFYRAVRGVPGLEFLGEDEGEAASDDDFVVLEKGTAKPSKKVPRRFYFTMPDERALQELASLWRRFQRGEDFGRGRAEWRKVFGHLANIRPWGPEDRLTQEAIQDWEERLATQPDQPVRFEVEFWHRENPVRRERTITIFRREVEARDGQVIDHAVIDQIRYHAALVELRPGEVRGLLDNPALGLATFDDAMFMRPQSIVAGPVDVDLEVAAQTEETPVEAALTPPVAALIDGFPVAQHAKLSGRLTIDDPDDFQAMYGQASEQRHGTAMASLILHGDLNQTNPPGPIARQLYVRPVMYPQQVGFAERQELMPPDRLGIDLIWRAFHRMFEGDGDEDPTAPTVRIVNLSLGDAKRRFAGVMSPWARLIDYVAWRYGLLILISAGNITDPVSLSDVVTWSTFEDATAEERQTKLLRAILQGRATRSILSPSESINSLTIGARHFDYVAPNGQGLMAVGPYASRFLPNPSSALGLGFRRSVKPELLFPGGAEQIRSNTTHAPIEVRPVPRAGSFFGIGTASPGKRGELDRKINMSGTSPATALATHGALRILDALEELPHDPPHREVDSAFYAVILKALLIHSAQWDENTATVLKTLVNENGRFYWEHEREEIARFLGFGCPDIARIVDCAAGRATLIGWNTIHAKEVDAYRVPLPVEFEGVAGFRAVSATVAWLSPVTLAHRMYRMAKIEAGPGGDKGFSLGVANARNQPSHNAVGRGTIYHRRWEGDEAADFVDDGNLLLDVTCAPTAGEFDESIPYGIAVTLEVGAGVAVPVYDRIRERLRLPIRVGA